MQASGVQSTYIQLHFVKEQQNRVPTVPTCLITWTTGGETPGSKMFHYLVVHGFLLADQLRAQDQHLLLADIQFLTGGVQLLQEHLVSRRARGPGACSCVTQQALPHLHQVMFQLLVL